MARKELEQVKSRSDAITTVQQLERSARGLHPQLGPPPFHLGDEEKHIWYEVAVAYPAAELKDSDRFALERFARTLAAYRQVFEGLTKEGWKVQGRNEAGYAAEVRNPLALELSKLEKTLQYFDQQFGMTPKARRQLDLFDISGDPMNALLA